jgi:uncharacterized OB-fold protein
VNNVEAATERSARPYPVPDSETEFYWAAARRSKLCIARCGSCGFFIHPPRAICPACWSEAVAAVEVSGRGHIYTYAINAVGGRVPGWEHYPYINVLVDLVEQAHLRVLANLINARADQQLIGIPVKVTFERISSNLVLPQFEPA